MANNNKNSILNAIYNVGTVQVLEGTMDTPIRVLVCGKTINITYGKNVKQITSIKINGEYYSTSAISSKADACQKVSMWLSDEDKAANNVSFSKDYLYLNGNKVAIFDLIKDIEDYNVFYSILSDNKLNGSDWQIEIANKVQEWLRDGGLQLWLEYRYYVEHSETIDETCLNVDDDESDLKYPVGI